MAPTSELEIQRLTVKELWDNNIRKPSEIIKITGFPKSTVYDIVNRLKKTGSVKHLPIPGRPLILSPTKRRYLGRLLKNDNATTSALMTTKLNNLYPNLNASHVEARLQWALNHNHDDWSHMIFSDESTFQTFCNTQIVRYKAGNLRPSHSMVKHPYKVHVWGAFSHQGPIGVALFTGKINSAKYREILQFQLLSNAYHAGYGWKFQQDNASTYTAKLTQQFFVINDVPVIDWPANSPDLNPIENLWAILKGNVEKIVNNWIMKKKLLSGDDFQGIIQQEWDNIDQNVFFNLADSMSDRINMVIKKNGYTINY
ncbi:IS630 family transposase [Rhizophagus clarus]|uniref:IS630 family transposase n=1 Tax=Rhizophagus clarus TaxID=94130 RepID=A0A8H3LCG5_9GLOM|nr:IS630 family transposase [Rhizophagus clarus]